MRTPRCPTPRGLGLGAGAHHPGFGQAGKKKLSERDRQAGARRASRATERGDRAGRARQGLTPLRPATAALARVPDGTVPSLAAACSHGVVCGRKRALIRARAKRWRGRMHPAPATTPAALSPAPNPSTERGASPSPGNARACDYDMTEGLHQSGRRGRRRCCCSLRTFVVASLGLLVVLYTSFAALYAMHGAQCALPPRVSTCGIASWSVRLSLLRTWLRTVQAAELTDCVPWRTHNNNTHNNTVRTPQAWETQPAPARASKFCSGCVKSSRARVSSGSSTMAPCSVLSAIGLLYM